MNARRQISAPVVWLAFMALLVGCAPASQAEQGPLVLDVNGFEGQLIGAHLGYIEDERGSLPPGAVRAIDEAGGFRSVTGPLLQPGYWTNSTYWLRLSVLNPDEAAVNWLLELDSHFVDSITLYDPGRAAPLEVGDLRPFGARPVAFRTFVLPILSAPGESTLYLRLVTEGNKKFPLRVYSPESFQEYRQRDEIINGLFLGALGVMLVYNLFLFLTVNEAGYLYVTLFIGAALVMSLYAFGIGFQMVWFDHPAWNRHMLVSIPLVCMPLVPYLRRILETPRRVPLLDRLLLGFFVLALVFVCIYPLVSFKLYARLGVTLMLPAAFLFFVLIVLVGGVGLGAAYPAGRYYLLGVSFFGVSLCLILMIMAGVFPDSFWSRTVVKAALVLFVAFLSMSLLFKIRWLVENLQRLNARAPAAEPEVVADESLEDVAGLLDEAEDFVSELAVEETESGHWSITPRMERKLQMALNFLRENYQEEISREGLAAELDVNPDNLGRLFKMYTGDKIGDYVNKLRVQAAAWRLRESDRKIAEIALEVGFENASTFNRVFKKVMKTTPSRFRDLALRSGPFRNF